MKRQLWTKIAGIFLLIIISGGSGYAQKADYYLGPVKYSFINYEADQILYPGSEKAFDGLYNQLDRLIRTGDGKIRIVHLGGSHIQADIYTHHLRKRFQELSPDMNGGRGLIFPFKIAGTNSPSNYSVAYNGNWTYCKSTQSERDCALGLTGMAVVTEDSALRMTINPNRDTLSKYSFNSVRVFHEPANYAIYIRSRDSLYTGIYDTEGGFTRIELPGYERFLDLRILRDTLPGRFILQGISLDSDMPGIVYDAIGVNGSMLKSFLGSEHYVKHLRAIEPQLVVFSIGTNDAYTRRFDDEGYRQRYIALLDSTRKAVPDAAILLTVPNDSYLYRKYANKNTAQMQAIIMELAEMYNCGVWDFYTIMGGLNSSQAWYSVQLMQPDRIHFNRPGYILKGELLFSAFLKSWENRVMEETHFATHETELKSRNIQ